MKKTTPPRKSFIKLYIQDVLLCALLLAASVAIMFFNLGDADFPQTAYHNVTNEPILIDFGQMVEFQGVVFLNGGSPNVVGFRIYSWDGENVSNLRHEETRDVRFR